MKNCSVLVLILLNCFSSLGLAESVSEPGFLNNGVTAHRGSSAQFPENTMSAFKHGIELGVDWLELDIFRTADGRLVVIHDRTTQRTGDQNRVVADSTYAELQEVDVATEFRRRKQKTPQECRPEAIPLLEDVLQLVMQQERTRVSIQPKMDCVADAVALVQKLQAERWVGFNDGNLAYMAQVKKLAPEIPVFWDRGPKTDIAADIETSRQHGFDALVVHHSGMTAEKLAAIHAAGLESGVWTVNDPRVMQQMLDLGVQRIYTDDPQLLFALKAGRKFQPVTCEGKYSHHLQGICTDQDAIYWSFTTEIVKTDLSGNILQQVSAPNHQGDLCSHEGKIYVAVNLAKFNDPRGNADSWVYVYRADDLSLVAKHEVPEVRHGAGGIEYRDGHFFVVGGLPAGVEENYVYEYDPQMKFVKRHTIASGYTQLGIQTVTFADDHWWFGCYGSPQTLLVTDAEFNLKGRYAFACSLGIEKISDGRFLVARGQCSNGKDCTGEILLAQPDANQGLKLIER